MDGREAMALSGGSAPYYIHRGGVGGSGSHIPGLHSPPGFRPVSNPGVSVQSHARGGSVGSAFPVEPSHVDFPHGMNMGISSGALPSEPPKKKRGRPRKYGPDGPVSLGLSPISATTNLSASPSTPTLKRGRGRPPGSGRKQQLATLGEWMNSSAGIAFAPHVITIGVGEDIAAKILSFAQQKPRALCILSGSGSVSSVTLRQSASSGGTLTFEGRFEILCLSGSYLVAEDGGPRNRTGGISVSLTSPDGHVIGGAVGTLVASSTVQVVVCSFIYGGSKTKNNTQGDGSEGDRDSEPVPHGKSAMPSSAPQSLSFSNPASVWPPSNSHADIDLMRG